MDYIPGKTFRQFLRTYQLTSAGSVVPLALSQAVGPGTDPLARTVWIQLLGTTNNQLQGLGSPVSQVDKYRMLLSLGVNRGSLRLRAEKTFAVRRDVLLEALIT